MTAYTPDEVYLNSATIEHQFKLSPDLYARVSAGVFERMYGGVSAEVLWRAPNRDFPLGLETTYARKRAYDDMFGFEAFDATTVIGFVYANVGARGDFVIVDAGQYIAGDFGVGLTIGRSFNNGWEISTTTTWSENATDSLQFGLNFSVPLGWTIPGSGTQDIDIGGYSGDDAARVYGTGRLYDTLRASDPQRLEDGWSAFWN